MRMTHRTDNVNSGYYYFEWNCNVIEIIHILSSIKLWYLCLILISCLIHFCVFIFSFPFWISSILSLLLVLPFLPSSFFITLSFFFYRNLLLLVFCLYFGLYFFSLLPFALLYCFLRSSLLLHFMFLSFSRVSFGVLPWSFTTSVVVFMSSLFFQYFTSH